MSCGNEYWMYDFCSEKCLNKAGYKSCSGCRGFYYDCDDCDKGKVKSND